MSADECQQVYLQVKNGYPSATEFEREVRVSIADHFCALHLNRSSVAELISQIKRHISNEAWSESEQMFRAIFVHILLWRQQNSHFHLSSICDFLTIYPEFIRLERAQQARLLQFRNAVVVAASIYDPRETWYTPLVLSCCHATSPGSCSSYVGAEAYTSLIIQRETSYFGCEHPPTHATSSSSGKLKCVQVEDESIVVTQTQRVDAAKRSQARAWLVKSFWSNIGARMEAGTDIPSADAAPGDTFLPIALMSHDLSLGGSRGAAQLNEWRLPGFVPTNLGQSVKPRTPHHTSPPAPNIIPEPS